MERSIDGGEKEKVCSYCGVMNCWEWGVYETESGKPLCYECWDTVYMLYGEEKEAND